MVSCWITLQSGKLRGTFVYMSSYTRCNCIAFKISFQLSSRSCLRFLSYKGKRGDGQVDGQTHTERGCMHPICKVRLKNGVLYK